MPAHLRAPMKNRAFLTSPDSPVVGDCVVADAVPIETVSDLNSLISGKIQGISRILAPNLDCDPQNKLLVRV